MAANLDNIHEIYNIFIQKNRMHADIITLFRRFHLSRTLSRLKMEKRFRQPVAKAASISFKLNPTSRYIVNVGSVGYPRNDLCSAYGIFDTEAQRVAIRRLPFDFKSYITEMTDRNLKLPAWLCRLLLAL